MGIVVVWPGLCSPPGPICSGFGVMVLGSSEPGVSFVLCFIQGCGIPGVVLGVGVLVERGFSGLSGLSGLSEACFRVLVLDSSE